MGGLLVAVFSAAVTYAISQHTNNRVLETIATMKANIETNTKRLDNVELRGSTALTAHIQSDDVRVEELSRRVAGLEAQREELAKTMNVIATDLRVLISKVEGLTLELKKHEDDSVKRGG